MFSGQWFLYSDGVCELVLYIVSCVSVHVGKEVSCIVHCGFLASSGRRASINCNPIYTFTACSYVCLVNGFKWFIVLLWINAVA